MGEKCCLCFPLDCGVKTLCVLTVLATVALSAQTVQLPEYKEIFLPFAVSMGILSLVWIMAWVSPTESAKNMLFLAYLVCGLVFNMGYQAYLTLNGQLADYQCRPEALSEYNDGVTELEQETDIDLGGTVTRSECLEQTGAWLWGDLAIKVLGTIYFSYVIMKWSKTSDGYVKI